MAMCADVPAGISRVFRPPAILAGKAICLKRPMFIEPELIAIIQPIIYYYRPVFPFKGNSALLFELAFLLRIRAYTYIPSQVPSQRAYHHLTMANRVMFKALCLAALVLASPASGSAAPGGGVAPRAISKMFSLGDSFGSGLAAGQPFMPADPGNTDCSRYDKAFGVQLKDNPRVQASSFTFLACSGSMAENVTRQQAPLIDVDADLITVSVGGNDVGWGAIVEGCVYRFLGPNSPDCNMALDNTTNLINSDSALFNPVFDTLFTILQRATKPTMRLYITGYPKFWNSETDQCDTVSWNFWSGSGGILMTKALRRRMNSLTDALNTKISGIVRGLNNAGQNRVVFVNPDPLFEGHRFCENGVIEPKPFFESRPNTYFFQIFTSVGSADGENVRIGGDDDVKLYYDSILAAPPGLTINPAYGAGAVVPVDRNAFGSSFYPVSVAKIFHPTTPGHAMVAEAIARAIQ
jgi:lysophospholipase L1-like esterase